MRKWVTVVVLVLLLFTIGCESLQSPKPVNLTIQYPSAKGFEQRYGAAYREKYPHVTIQVIEGRNAPQGPTDLVFMNSLAEYERQSREGKLHELDSFLQRNPGMLSRLSPVVVSLLHNKSPNKLFGLAPGFTSYAIYYNKDLFRQFGIPEPRDQMSWQELLALAERFPVVNKNGGPLYGFKSDFYRNIAIGLILRIGQTEGRSFIDPSTLKVHMEPEIWKPIWEQITKAVRKGVLYDQEDSEQTSNADQEPPSILSGQVAMQWGSQVLSYNFAQDVKMTGGNPINWGLVTVPVDLNQPDLSDFYSLQEIFGISVNSQHAKEAWKFISFLSSDKQLAAIPLNHINTLGLPAQIGLVAQPDGRDLSPLFKLIPPKKSFDPYQEVPYPIINAFSDVGQKLVEEVLENKITEEEALLRISIEGQAAVDAARVKATRFP
ncbi:ABC transporter substrate-binding protein [Paenibacillus koleovorans]|uniref:ABC transporter substrate-binding protein n=1 Tax=Paenibacillus koleovorans TaxID=121608 RepID=UPI000FD82D9B|nr:ABC transporter substrate-binding protein [Paenibacillus koleovorans]